MNIRQNQEKSCKIGLRLWRLLCFGMLLGSGFLEVNAKGSPKVDLLSRPLESFVGNAKIQENQCSKAVVEVGINAVIKNRLIRPFVAESKSVVYTYVKGNKSMHTNTQCHDGYMLNVSNAVLHTPPTHTFPSTHTTTITTSTANLTTVIINTTMDRH